MRQVIADKNTRFALPIVCPKSGDVVSAETLYNRCCADLGYVVRDHIGDLVFDNLDYDAGELGTDEANNALHDAVYAWARGVRAEIANLR